MWPTGPSTGILTGVASGTPGVPKIAPLTCDRAPLDIHRNEPKILKW
jgi:hypothetical protein